jgi:hypothetical protein
MEARSSRAEAVRKEIQRRSRGDPEEIRREPGRTSVMQLEMLGTRDAAPLLTFSPQLSGCAVL